MRKRNTCEVRYGSGRSLVQWNDQLIPATSATENGNCSNPCYRHPNRVVDPSPISRREIVNASRYVLRTGCSWRMLPHDLPPWRIVFHYFRTWRKDGTWQRANCVHCTSPCDRPRVERRVPARPSSTASRPRPRKKGAQRLRRWQAGKGSEATYRGGHAGTAAGRDAVHPADIQDRDGAKLVLAKLLDRFPRLQLIWADGAYGGKLVQWAQTVGGWTLELVRRAATPAHFPGAAPALGGGAHLRLVEPATAVEQGLRSTV